MQNYCNKHNIQLPENNKNKRYIINAIARNGALPQKNTDKYKDKILVGIMTDKIVLKERIRKRAKIIVNDTTINEAMRAAQTWGWDNEAMTGNVYPLIRKYVAGKLTHSELEEKLSNYNTIDNNIVAIRYENLSEIENTTYKVDRMLENKYIYKADKTKTYWS